MTQFLNKTFSVHVGGDQEYRDNWDRIFGKKRAPEPVEPEPECNWLDTCSDWEHDISCPVCQTPDPSDRPAL